MNSWGQLFDSGAPSVTPELERNLGAMRVRRLLDAEEREPSPAESAVLAQYTADFDISVPDTIPEIADFSDLPPVPIFIIHFNRGSMLRKVIASYQMQSVPTEIIVHDNGSDGPDTLVHLAELEAAGIKIFRRSKISNVRELANVNETITEVLATRGDAPYVVTDCDVQLLDPGALAVYLELLAAAPQAVMVGPMLRIEDLDPAFPLYNDVYNWNIAQFWRKSPCFTKIGNKSVAYQPADIDTTFAVLRPHQKFERLQPGLRVYAPYDARHLDWYAEELVDEYRSSAGSNISHYSNGEYIENVRANFLEYDEFLKIVPHPDGTLATEVHQIPFNLTHVPREKLETELIRLRTELANREQQIHALQGELLTQAEAQQKQVDDFLNSRTWRVGKLIMAPLRALQAVVNRVRH